MVMAVEASAGVGLKVEAAVAMEAVAMVDKKDVEVVTVALAATGVEEDMDPRAWS